MLNQSSQLDQIVATLPEWRNRLRLIVVDEPTAAELNVNLAAWIRTQSGVGVACAYCDLAKIRKLFNSRLYPGAISSFFPLNLNFDAWVSMLKLCLAGHAYVTPELFASPGSPVESANQVDAEPAAVPLAKDKPAPIAENRLKRLTQREKEVLQNLAKGNQNKVIAASLGLSENTVKLHIHHIISKLGVHNRTEAAMIHAQTIRQ